MSQLKDSFLDSLHTTDTAVNSRDSAQKTSPLHDQYISSMEETTRKPLQDSSKQISQGYLVFNSDEGAHDKETAEPELKNSDASSAAPQIPWVVNRFGGPAVDQPSEDNMLTYAILDFKKISQGSGEIDNVQEIDKYIENNKSMSNNELMGLEDLASHFNQIEGSSKPSFSFLEPSRPDTGISLNDLKSYGRQQQAHREMFE